MSTAYVAAETHDLKVSVYRLREKNPEGIPTERERVIFIKAGTAERINLSPSVEINDVHPSEVKIKSVGQAPDVVGNTTANCRIAVSASAGWIAGAFGFGTSVLDAGCDTGRDIEILKSLGLRDAAILRACAKKELAAAMGNLCPVKASEAADDKPGRS